MRKITTLLLLGLCLNFSGTSSNNENTVKIEEDVNIIRSYLTTRASSLKFEEYSDSIDQQLDKRVSDYLARLNVMSKFNNEEKVKINTIARKYSLKPEWLYFVFYKESRCNPQAENKSSGAYGLLQILPSTAKNMGTSVEELKLMPTLDYLDYVDKYLSKIIGNKKLTDVVDVYLAVFYPKAMNKTDNFVIGNNNKVVEQNKIMDYNQDNIITKKEFRTFANFNV